MNHVNGPIILPPNKQMDVQFVFSQKPVLYDHLIFLDFSATGKCLLGSADLQGTFWEGTLMYFDSPEELLNFKHSKYYINTTASDAKFMNEETIAIGEDTGLLNILTVDDSSTLKQMNFFRHPKRISQIEVWNSSSNVLTCSGLTVTIWDVNSSEKIPSFLSQVVHYDNINSVDTFKNHKDLFVTASSDRRAFLWDIRSDEPPSVIYNNEFCSLNRIEIDPTDTNYIAIGTQGGDVYLIDKREPGEFLSTFHCFNKPIRSLSFNNQHQLGACGDINEVIILNCHLKSAELSEVSRNKEHSGHVKAVKWLGDDNLYSAGFGEKKLVRHQAVQPIK